jgi:hypothetical protein
VNTRDVPSTDNRDSHRLWLYQRPSFSHNAA